MIKYVSLAENELRKKSKKILITKYNEKKFFSSQLSNIFRKYLSIPSNDDFERKIIYHSNPSFINYFLGDLY